MQELTMNEVENVNGGVEPCKTFMQYVWIKPHIVTTCRA